MGLFNRSLNKKVRDLVEQSTNRVVRFVSYQNLQSCFILTDSESLNQISDGIEKMKKDGKNVFIGVLSLDKRKQQQLDWELNLKKNVGFSGLPSKELVESLKKFDVDAFIVLTKFDSALVEYLTLSHPSTFKIGIGRGENSIYDFAITQTKNSDIRFLFEQIFFYLQTIDSKQ